MCGVVGYVDLRHQRPADERILREMMRAVLHRGPDSAGVAIDGAMGMGFRRLSIIDLSGGDQPLYNEDESIVLVCNGEIFNYDELVARFGARHRLKTHSDCEAIVHLYEEFGDDLLDHLNGQFAFALYDKPKRRLVLARDPFGVAPLYYTVRDDVLIFASEIKALLKHPLVRAEVDLAGLDQIVCFPGLVSPRTMFAGIKSLPPGCRLVCENGAIAVRPYWDVDYPLEPQTGRRSAADYEAELLELFRASVRRRLRADVPVGLYISGGLDSSMIAAMTRELRPSGAIQSFSVAFDDKQASEEKYQRLMATAIGAEHHEIRLRDTDIFESFSRMIFHAERPVKETYNTCAMALSGATRDAGIKVILGGEGADEFFAGYPGYRFDALRAKSGGAPVSGDEAHLRQTLWGDPTVAYERNYLAFGQTRRALYAPGAREAIERDGALSAPPVDPARLAGRHALNQRSYLDFRLRLADHLLGDHGDHMLMANSVEGRYPFLDRPLIELARTIPPNLKMHGFDEKFILKRIAARLVPGAILRREKFGFYSVSSPALLRAGLDWVDELLSYDAIKRQGYFCADTVERLKTRYRQPDFRLDPRYEDDLILIVLSFNLMQRMFFA